MTAVELVSNPDGHTSTHEWVAVGVNNLTRQNKLSSLPFWIPNDETRHHQLRLILLRGIEPAKTASEDAIGLIVELIAPPTGAEAERSPGGCSFTVSVRDEAGEEVVPRVTEMGQLDESNNQICMPQLIPATALQAQQSRHQAPSSAVLSEQTGEAGGEAWLRVKLQLTITTGVNVIAGQIVRSVSAWWSTVSSSISQLATKTSEVYQQHREEIDALLAVGGTEGTSDTLASPRTGPEHKALPPWQVVPTAWQDRAEQWRRLVAHELVEDEGTFLYGPERVPTPDARALLLQTGVMYKTILDAQREFNPERDISEALLTNEVLQRRHYHLVPRRIPDATFWANYFWKVACVARCVDRAQVQAVLTVFNAPPSAPHETARAAAGDMMVADSDVADPLRYTSLDAGVEDGSKKSSTAALNDAAAMAVLHDAQEAADLLLEYLSEWDGAKDRLLVEAAVRTCDEHAKQLQEMGRQTGLASATLLRQQAVAQQLCSCLTRYDELVRQPTVTQAREAKPTKAESATVAEVSCGVEHADSARGPREGGSRDSCLLSTAGRAETIEADTRHVEPCESGEAGKASALQFVEPRSTTNASALPLDDSEIQFAKMPWEEE